MKHGTIGRSVRLLPKSDRRKIVIVVFIQMGLGIFDLIAVVLIGMLGALTVNGIQSKQPGTRIQSVLELSNLENLTSQRQVAVLGGIAAIILVLRTLISIYFSRLTLFFLSRRAAIISTKLIGQLLSRPLLFIKERNSQETLYAVTNGVLSITLGVIATLVSLISDGLLLLILAVGLLVVDPVTAFLTFLMLGAVAFVLHALLQKRAKFLGMENSRLAIEGNNLILQVLDSYREAMVSNRRHFYADKISESRLNLANLNAEVAFMPNISKYTIEITMVISALAISAFQFLFYDAGSAIATLAVFLTASARIGPAILRIQQGLIQIKNSIGTAQPTLNLIERLSTGDSQESGKSRLNTVHSGFVGEISVREMSLHYPDRAKAALDRVSLNVNQGEFIALVGSSGAGKTSLVDVILGLIHPTSGEVRISGQDPEKAISRWPGAISYVPQDIYVADMSIRENVAMGYEGEEVREDLIREALGKAQLDSFVNSLPHGLDERVGERGSKLSGGQRQRLGIARALYTKPKIIVFDEATSSLDVETEAELTKTISALRGEITIIMIAHRLSTVRSADQVVYLEEGSVVATGTFDEVRTKVPRFENQAQLLGL